MLENILFEKDFIILKKNITWQILDITISTIFYNSIIVLNII